MNLKEILQQKKFVPISSQDRGKNVQISLQEARKVVAESIDEFLERSGYLLVLNAEDDIRQIVSDHFQVYNLPLKHGARYIESSFLINRGIKETNYNKMLKQALNLPVSGQVHSGIQDV